MKIHSLVLKGEDAMYWKMLENGWKLPRKLISIDGIIPKAYLKNESFRLSPKVTITNIPKREDWGF